MVFTHLICCRLLPGGDIGSDLARARPQGGRRHYDGDIQDAEGFPPGAEGLRRRLEEADAFVISSPEYNFSMPGALKNVIDWVSRYRPQPFKGKHCLLMSASPSMAGGNRGLWTLRQPLEHLGANVYPDMAYGLQASR